MTQTELLSSKLLRTDYIVRVPIGRHAWRIVYQGSDHKTARHLMTLHRRASLITRTRELAHATIPRDFRNVLPCAVL